MVFIQSLIKKGVSLRDGDKYYIDFHNILESMCYLIPSCFQFDAIV